MRTIRDFTIYLGELTILPGDKPIRELIKDLFRLSWAERFLTEAVADKKPDEEDVEEAAATATATAVRNAN